MDLLFTSLLTFIAAFIGTVAGFGISTILLPVLILFFPLAQALLFVGILHWFNDIWKIILFKKGMKWKLILLFAISAIVTSFLGALLVFRIPTEILLKILGIFISLYAIFIFIQPHFKLKQTKKNIISGGLLSGFIAGLFGIGGEVRAAFISAFDLKKATYLATIGIIGLAIDSTRIATYFFQGARLASDQLMGLILLVPLSFLGAFLAKFAVDKIPQKYFRKIISVFIFLLVIKIIFFP
jgi:uncharacterized protein